MSVEKIKQLLCENDITPNRALGQNFLSDDAAAVGIVVASFADSLPILEIGPGLGALTEPLLNICERVVAVEIDKRMAMVLQKEFENRKNFTLVNDDFIKTPLVKIHELLGEREFAVVGNLPYYITTPIGLKLVSSKLPIENITVMVQREAAERFCAKPKDRTYSALSVLSGFYFDVENIMALSPASYYPQPDVESRVIRLSRKKDVERIDGFERFLSAAFAMRRKTLVNNLKPLGLSKQSAEEILESCGVDAAVRTEDLSPEKLAEITKRIACAGNILN